MKRLEISQGVRQGSVEATVFFVILFDLMLRAVSPLRRNEQKATPTLSEQNDRFGGRGRWHDCSSMDCSGIAFMDVLMSMLIISSIAKIKVFIIETVAVFENCSLDINYDKL